MVGRELRLCLHSNEYDQARGAQQLLDRK